jgi:hypothetical protein
MDCLIITLRWWFVTTREGMIAKIRAVSRLVFRRRVRGTMLIHRHRTMGY